MNPGHSRAPFTSCTLCNAWEGMLCQKQDLIQIHTAFSGLKHVDGLQHNRKNFRTWHKLQS
jgi:hypothetical protein